MKLPLRLLLIDDDDDDRDFFCTAVQQIDPAIECTTLSDGAAGLRHLEEPDKPLPDYIFLDLRMPGMSGRKLLKIIKDNPRTSHIPVMVYTTSTDVKDAKELEKLGATHFTSKPSNPDEIYYVLSVILGEKW